jgi:hypothetical protein
VSELVDGEDTLSSSFHGLDGEILRKALAVLESDGRVRASLSCIVHVLRVVVS